MSSWSCFRSAVKVSCGARSRFSSSTCQCNFPFNSLVPCAETALPRGEHQKDPSAAWRLLPSTASAPLCVRPETTTISKKKSAPAVHLLIAHVVKDGLHIQHKSAAEVGILATALQDNLRHNFFQQLEVVQSRKQGRLVQFLRQWQLNACNAPCHVIVANDQQVLQDGEQVREGWGALELLRSASNMSFDLGTNSSANASVVPPQCCAELRSTCRRHRGQTARCGTGAATLPNPHRLPAPKCRAGQKRETTVGS